MGDDADYLLGHDPFPSLSLWAFPQYVIERATLPAGSHDATNPPEPLAIFFVKRDRATGSNIRSQDPELLHGVPKKPQR
jgi:hypothetical protein